MGGTGRRGGGHGGEHVFRMELVITIVTVSLERVGGEGLGGEGKKEGWG